MATSNLSRLCVLLALFWVVAAGCSHSRSRSPLEPTARGVAAAGAIESAGGSFTVLSGPLAGACVSVPAGASSTTITVVITQGQNITASGFTPVGPVLKISPCGVSLRSPAGVCVPYTPGQLPAGSSPSDIVVLHTDDGTGVVTVLEPQSTDAGANTVGVKSLTLCCFQAAVPTPPTAGAVSTVVTLKVTEPSGTARPQEPITIGIPLPLSPGFTSTTGLGLLDGTTQLPVQWRVLSRWGGAPDNTALPIRWLLADFQLSLAAGESRDIALVSGAASVASVQALEVDSTDPTFLRVNTGPLSVRISRSTGALITGATIGGQTVCDDPTPDLARSGITLVDGDGTVYRSALSGSPAVSVEEQGPLRVVVRVASPLRSAGGVTLHPGEVQVVSRLTFYNGLSVVKIRTQLENNAPYGPFDTNPPDPTTVLNFRQLRLDVPLALGPARRFQTPGYSAAGTPANTWRVYQSHQVVVPDDESQNFSYTVRLDGAPAAAGARHDGWVDVSDGALGVTAAIRWFWQNYEKGITASANTLSLELWPDGGTWPPGRPDPGRYLFEGSRHKGYEMLLAFRSGAAAVDATALDSRFSFPVVPRCPGGWYASTGALGITDSGDQTFSDSRVSAGYARYNDLMRLRVGAIPPDPSRAGTARNIIEAREMRYQAPGAFLDWYGWANFGDDVWGDGYSSNHYDLPGFLLIHYLRLGDRAFWDEAEPKIRQAIEFGQVWGVDPNPGVASISFYEKTQHGLIPEEFRPVASHNWLHRLVLYHWLTGDPFAQEAALMNAQGLWRNFYQSVDISDPGSFSLTDPNSMMLETRFFTWTLENWLYTYFLTGDSRWMQGCEDLVRCVLYKFQAHGQIDGPSPRTYGYSLPSYYGVEPLIRFYVASTNDSLKSQVLDMLRGIVSTSIQADMVDASGSGASYLPAAIADNFSGGPQPDDYDTLFNGSAASALAFVGFQGGDAALLARANRLWVDGVFYPEYFGAFPARPFQNEDQFEAWGWASSQFPGSDEKALSRQTRFGIPFLWTMQQLQGVRARSQALKLGLRN